MGGDDARGVGEPYSLSSALKGHTGRVTLRDLVLAPLEKDTSDTYRRSQRSKVWRDGWRNLRSSSPRTPESLAHSAALRGDRQKSQNTRPSLH